MLKILNLKFFETEWRKIIYNCPLSTFNSQLHVGGVSMEFKINKIDMEIRQRINDKRKEGKVHSNGNVKINKVNPDKDDNSRNDKFQQVMSKLKKNKKKITVQAVKDDSLEVEAFKDEIMGYEDKGEYLDIKK